MVNFNRLKNTIAASAIGIATTMCGCTAKQPKAVLKNVNQLERQYATDVLEFTGKANKLKLDSLKNVNKEGDVFKESMNQWDECNKLTEEFLQIMNKLKK